MEMKNREQRRREKFGKAGKVHQHNPLGPWPESEANPALKNVVPDQPAVAPDQPAVAPGDDSGDDAAETAPKTPVTTDKPAKAPRPAARPVAKAAKG